jgi:ERO1-like protein beta
MCGNIACAVNTLDNEEDIPLIWRADALGKLEGPKAGHPGKKLRKERKPEKPLQGMLGDDVGESCVVEYDDECDDRDYCVPEDESATAKGDYVSLVDNPERFTGYSGEGAQMVWDAIYRENCFSRSSFPASASLGKSPFPNAGPAANDLKSVLFNPNLNAPGAEVVEIEDECLEKRVFYRVISGMHASISTHLCWDYLNQTTGEWTPNLNCYVERLHKHPERISNLYFNYALIVRAVAKLGPYLKNYTFCSGDVEQDRETKMKVQELTATAAQTPQIFDESLMFVNGEGPSLKEDFRNRFRNISRLMDCVGCDKCRLWGKLQTAGYGTALKILFEYDNEGQNKDTEIDAPFLKRTEIVALFNTLARISSSLSSVEKFRDIVEAREHAEGGMEGEHWHKISDRERLPHHVIPEEDKERTLRDVEAKNGKGGVEETGDDEDDYEELMQELEREKSERQKRLNDMGVMDVFWAEFEVVFKVLKFVLMSYVRLPKFLYVPLSHQSPCARSPRQRGMSFQTDDLD